MLAEKFSEDEAEDETKQQRVRRLAASLASKSVTTDTDTTKSATTKTATSVNLERRTPRTKPSSVVTVDRETAAARLSFLSPLTPATRAGKRSSSASEWDTEPTSNSDSNEDATPSKKARVAAAEVELLTYRKTSNQKQKSRTNICRIWENEKQAFKVATATYNHEKRKKNGRSAQQVVDRINSQRNSNLNKRTIQHHVKLGNIGVSPTKRGPNPGNLSNKTWACLKDAFVSYIEINQANGDTHKNTRQDLKPLVNKAIDSKSDSWNMVDRLLDHTGVNLNATVNRAAEERRVRWCTYRNLKMWFGKWRQRLEELGFGYTDDDGKFVIPEDQLRRILNLDETNLSVDGSNQRRGGRPAVAFVNPSLPRLGEQVPKSGYSLTLITGSTAAGEALPPHFQFATRATDPARIKIRFDAPRYTKRVRGTFGNRDSDGNLRERIWPCTFASNEKGGMDDQQFKEYIKTNILPLYPDVANEDGKRVVIKLDSGPGRKNQELLAQLRVMGFILFPCVPNSTAVTQEADQSYGVFKTKLRQNLARITSDRLEHGKPAAIPPHLIGLLVFGGVDPDTHCTVPHDAFAIAFTKAKNLSSWAKVGAAPFTEACLKSHLVRHDGKDDPLWKRFQQMERQNELACLLLTEGSYYGHHLRVELKENLTTPQSVTVPQTQEHLEALAKAKTHGELFFVTGGDHLTTDDAFKAAELKNREKDIELMEKDKEQRIAAEEKERAALAILEVEPPIEVDHLTGKQLKILLSFYGVKNKDQGRNVAEMRTKYSALKASNATPQQYQKWTEADEEELTYLKDSEIGMKDTAVGRYEQNQKIVMKEIAKKMPMEDKLQFIREVMGEDTIAAAAAKDTEECEQGDSDLSTVYEVPPWAQSKNT